MKYTASYGHQPPIGFAENAVRNGGNVTVSTCRLVTSSDGEEFATRVESLANELLMQAPGNIPIMPQAVQDLFVILAPGGAAQVYVNEMDVRGSVRLKGKGKKGGLITKNQILDYGRFQLKNISIAPQDAFFFVVSVGWRRALFYDLRVLDPKAGATEPYDIGELLASVYSYLTFYSRFSISDDVWQTLMTQRWFPFSYLDDALINKMISHAKEGWRIDDLLPEVKACVDALVKDNPPQNWTEPFYNDHREIIQAAAARYADEDYISCVSVLFPRLEGIMRSFLRHSGDTRKPTSTRLAKAVSEANAEHRIGLSILFPSRFRAYLGDVFFANFAPGSAPDAGRHSVAHGEAKAASFDLKSACIALLVLYQSRLLLTDGKKMIEQVGPPDR